MEIIFSSRKGLIQLQYLTFWYQAMASCIIYIPTLLVTLYLVNYDKSHRSDFSMNLIDSPNSFWRELILSLKNCHFVKLLK